MHASILTHFWVKQFEINFPIQRQAKISLDLAFQTYEPKSKVMNCIKSMIMMS